jgi:hypothetical protein
MLMLKLIEFKDIDLIENTSKREFRLIIIGRFLIIRQNRIYF